MQDEIREGRFDTGDVVLNYAEAGMAGPPLVMLHGGTARWQGFSNMISDLAAAWHLYLPDFRGHGLSGRTPGRYQLANFAADICAFLAGRVPEPAVLFGHSLGGGVALMTAARCPERVAGVIVGDAPLDRATWEAALQLQRADLLAWRELAGGDVPLEGISAALQNMPSGVADLPRLVDLFGEDHPFFKSLAETLYQQDPAVLTAMLDDFARFAQGYEMETLLPAVRCPVLLLQADPMMGAVMSDAEVERALALLPRGQHMKLAGLGHAFHNERKELVVEAINRFADER